MKRRSTKDQKELVDVTSRLLSPWPAPPPGKGTRGGEIFGYLAEHLILYEGRGVVSSGVCA